MMLKALPLAHFLNVLVKSAQNQSVSRKFVHKIPTKSAILYQLFCSEVSAENFREILVESDDFPTNPSLKILQNLTFFSATFQKPCKKIVTPMNQLKS